MKKPLFRVLLLFLLVSCARNVRTQASGGLEYAQWFDLTDGAVVIHSPFGAPDDTLQLGRPVRSVVCMSSSYIGFLDALGCDSVVTAVSGLDYVQDPEVRGSARDVGYDAALNYELILRLKPDLLLTYAVSAAEPPYLAKLRELGVRPVLLHEHLESHPLARAEYIKLFGALTGREAAADSIFRVVRDRYLELVDRPEYPKKVLVNIPYADQWYIPGGDNYMTRLIEDAGGTVLGAVPGQFQSSVISVEKAFEYAQEADLWLNPGWCRTKAQLGSVHPLFSEFPVLSGPVWNNTLQETPGGGNAFWETGPARPDLILRDLRAIFEGKDAPMAYYVPVR